MSQPDSSSIFQALDQFFFQFPHLHFSRNQTILQANQQPSHVLYLTEGKVKQYTISHKGNEVTLNIFHPYAFFPMSCIVNQTPNDYYYVALTNVQIYKAPMEPTLAFLKREPTVLFDLLQRVYRGTDGLTQRLSYLLADNTYASLINELLISAKRFGTIDPQTGQAIVSINQSDIGALSGMSRETVNREMAILKRKGLITFDRHQLTINNIQQLETELYDHS